MKILVPLDGSLQSESILPLASQLAERWQAQLLALRVTDPTLGALEPMSSVLAESMVEAGKTYLEELQARHPDKRLQTHHEVGFPRSCIEQLAASEGCEMILMASHGHEGLTRWLWGSVAEGVARHAPCPTMLLRSPDADVQFRDILIPTDGSEESLSVARRIGRFLRPETKVTLLHCFGAPPQQKSDYLELARIRTHLRSQVNGRPWMRLEFSDTPAPQGILDWIARHDCHLVAMSTHGRDGLAHLWNGSVTEQVARQARCPVLIFPPATVHSQPLAER